MFAAPSWPHPSSSSTLALKSSAHHPHGWVVASHFCLHSIGWGSLRHQLVATTSMLVVGHQPIEITKQLFGSMCILL